MKSNNIVTENSNNVKALYLRVKELMVNKSQLDEELQAANNRNVELEQQVADITATRQQDIAENEKRVSRLVTEKFQYQHPLDELRASFETLALSAGSSSIIEHLRGDLHSARTEQRKLQTELEDVRRDRESMREHLRCNGKYPL